MAALTDHTGVWWETATQIQRDDARAMLDLDGPRRHWIGRAKGYSKTRDVAGVSAVVLLTQMDYGEMAYVGASDADQAGLIRQSIAAFVANTPALRSEIIVESRRVVAPKRGTELIILPADSAGANGIRPKWLVIDELANFPDVEKHREFFDNAWAGLPKVSDSRGVIITTAGSPGHFSHKIFETAAKNKLWRLSDIKGPAPWHDPAEIESERQRQFPSKFARFWMNEWTSADDAIADPADVTAACVLKGPLAPEPGRRYLCTLDLGTRNDRTVACISHAERAGDGTQVVVDRLQVWTPTRGNPVSLDDVRMWLIEFCRSYSCQLLYDPSQAYLMIEQLRRADVRCREFLFTSSSVGHLATAIMQALRSRLLVLPDDEELRKEILTVRLRETSSNVMRIDTKGSGHDDRVIAIAMGVYDLTSGTHPGNGPIHPLSDAEWAVASGRIPPVLPAVSGKFAGITAMPDSVDRDWSDDHDPDRFKGKPSPFV
jgi:hypothetical protein